MLVLFIIFERKNPEPEKIPSFKLLAAKYLLNFLIFLWSINRVYFLFIINTKRGKCNYSKSCKVQLKTFNHTPRKKFYLSLKNIFVNLILFKSK